MAPIIKRFPKYKLKLLDSLPTRLSDVLEVVFTGPLGLTLSQRMEAHVKSGFLLLKTLTKTKDIMFLKLDNAKITFGSSKHRDKLSFTIQTEDKEKVALRIPDIDKFECWKEALLRAQEKPVYDLSQFDVLESFGKGSFGEVNIVLHRATQEVLAIKRVSVKGASNSMNVNERVILEKVNDIRDKYNVSCYVKLHLAFNEGDDLFLLTEAYQGGSLFDLIVKQKRLRFDEDVVKFIIGQLSFALKFLHLENIAHRDLKPENIMFDVEGNIKLIDFGLSTQFVHKKNYTVNEDEELFSGNQALSKSYQVVGTSFYQAPEMLGGYGHDLSSDWWQIGCITYELLFGRPLFAAKSSQEVEELIKTKLPLEFPANQFSDGALEIISALVTEQPVQRLGYVGDADEVLEHEFLRGALEMEVPAILKTSKQVEPKEKAPVNLKDFVSRYKLKGKRKKTFWNKYDLKQLNRMGIDYVYQPALSV